MRKQKPSTKQADLSTDEPSYYDTFEGRGQEEQDGHDLLNGLLERESRNSPDSPPADEPDPMQPGIDALENWLQERARKELPK